MDDVVGIAEVQLASVGASLEKAFWSLNPISFRYLTLHSRRECAEDFIILEELDLGVDGCAYLQTKYDCIVYLELDADSCPRPLFQGVLLLDKLLELRSGLTLC